MNFDNHNNNEDMFEDYMVHKMSTEDTPSSSVRHDYSGAKKKEWLNFWSSYRSDTISAVIKFLYLKHLSPDVQNPAAATRLAAKAITAPYIGCGTAYVSGDLRVL